MNSSIEELFSAVGEILGVFFKIEGPDGSGLYYADKNPEDYYNYRDYSKSYGEDTASAVVNTDIHEACQKCKDIQSIVAASNTLLSQTWGITADCLKKLGDALCDELMSFEGDVIAFVNSTRENEGAAQKAITSTNDAVQDILNSIGIE